MENCNREGTQRGGGCADEKLQKRLKRERGSLTTFAKTLKDLKFWCLRFHHRIVKAQGSTGPFSRRWKDCQQPLPSDASTHPFDCHERHLFRKPGTPRSGFRVPCNKLMMPDRPGIWWSTWLAASGCVEAWNRKKTSSLALAAVCSERFRSAKPST